MGPFDRFNDRAKRVLALAQDEAIRLNHNYIGPEHLLLGLVREGEGVAARVLDSLGLQLSTVREQVERKIGRGDSGMSPSEITLHPRTKKVVELALEEARKLEHHQVGTEHVLLGLVRDDGSVAAEVLQSLGVSLEKIRHQVIATLRQQRPPGIPPSSMPPTPSQPQPFDAEGRRRDWYCEDVLSGKIEVRKLYEDERVLGIEHPYPQYRVHGVVIPKAHIASLLSDEALNGELLTSMLRGVQAVARALGLDREGFRFEANAASPGVTPHMHWHVAGPGLPPPRVSAAGAGQWIGSTLPTPRPGRVQRGRGRVAGPGPFDRFDDPAKRVLALAQDEAIRFRHNYIGTEHLLAGLVREKASIGARALEELGVELSKVRTALEFIIGRGERPTAPNDITLSPRTKKVIELAIDEARKMNSGLVTSGHILLGLVREGEGIASGVLESLGVSLEMVRHKVIELMGKEPPPSRPGPPP
jgi:ATP-dependent Clp protease ATP-binding subunit ClpA